MTQAQALLTPLPAGTSVTPGTLRAEMEARRAAGRRFEVHEALRLLVPLCTRLAQHHADGERLFVSPSSLGYREGANIEVLDRLAATAPMLPRDRACLAPEERHGGAGDARASVFAIGAILYEMITGGSVGPGMRRPADVVADLPPTLEAVMGKALVADPRHRPADLAALAQALHNVAPTMSMRPPSASQVLLDEGGIEVDVSMSVIPPSGGPGAGGAAVPAIPTAPAVPRFQSVSGSGPYAVAIPVAQAPARNANDPTQRLADLKVSLESDPRPRYVVIKDGMDHGPFSAVELLQQIASGQFRGDQVLRDTFLQEERPIQDWEEFAPFAEQAKLNQDIVQEKKAFEQVVQKERQGMQYKALIGVALMGVILAGGVGFWLRQRAKAQAALAVQDRSGTIEVDVKGGLEGPKGGGAVGAGGPRPAGGGNYPVLGGGMSCESAQARYVEEYKIGGGGGPADLTAGAYGAVLNRGSYLNSCGVPSSMSVNICAAVQNGRAVGVTVTTDPPNPGIASCVAGQVRGLPFPSHPRLDVTRTTFAAN